MTEKVQASINIKIYYKLIGIKMLYYLCKTRQRSQWYRIENNVTNNHVNVNENDKKIACQIKYLSIPNAGKRGEKKELIQIVGQIRIGTQGEQLDCSQKNNKFSNPVTQQFNF